MLKRIITAIVALIIFVPVLIFADTMIFPVMMALCAAIGCYEMFSCLGLKDKVLMTLPMYAAALCLPISKRLIPDEVFVKFVLSIIGVLIVYMLGIAVFRHKKVNVTDVGLSIALGLYIVAAFTGLVYLHDSVEHGKYIYLLTFLCAWMTDTFAYFTGRLFGKHKLIPEVSPKKTVEGAVGGVVFCVITMLVFGLVMETNFGLRANYITLAISGVFISVVSQLGDLIMSLVKRHYGIKDYGKIFPGHGGILDRFDSVTAVTLVLTFICTYFNLLV